MEYGFIYIWYDRKHKRYYVGKHWGPTDDGYLGSSTWLKNSLKRRSQDFRRRILTYVYDRDFLAEEEQRWLNQIKKEELGKRYYNLNNKNSRHWHDDPNARLSVGKKLSNSIRKRWASLGPEEKAEHAEKTRRQFTGRKLSEEHKAKISAFRKANDWTPEHKAALIASRKGKSHTPETRAKMRAAKLGRKLSEEQRAKMTESQRRRRLKERSSD